MNLFLSKIGIKTGKQKMAALAVAGVVIFHFIFKKTLGKALLWTAGTVVIGFALVMGMWRGD